ncbi:MAG: hypothetical protein ACE5WD_06025, partial [Candidatus Aminicenantia bacterium]
AAWLFWIAVGAQVGSYLSTRIKHLRSIFLSSIILGVLISIAQIYLIRTVRSILEIPQGQYIPFTPMFYFTILAIAPFSFMIGFTFPIGCRLFSVGKEKGATTIGWVYVFEAFGSLLGGVIFTFLLVGYVSTYIIVGILIFVVLSVSTGFLFKGRFLKPLAIGVFIILIGIAYFSFSYLKKLEQLTIIKRWNSISERIELLKSIDTKYQNVVIAEQSGQYSVFGNGHVAFSFPDEYGYANQANFVLAQHPNPKRVLLIGNGAGGLIRQMLMSPLAVLHYVQLDSKLISAIYSYLPDEDKKALKNPIVKIFYTDGRFFVKTTREKYDLVFLDLPDPSTAMLNRYYTLEFFQEVKEILTPTGVLALYLTSSENYFGEVVADYTGSVFHTLRKVFPYVVISSGNQNHLFASMSSGIVTSDLKILEKRYSERKIKTPYFSKYNFFIIFQPERVEFVRRSLLERKGVKLNTDLRPVTYFFNLLLWDKFSRPVRLQKSRFERFLKWVENLNFKWAILVISSLVLIRILYVFFVKRDRFKQQKFNCLFAVAAGGFAAMGFEIILIFAFQNLYGYLYQRIALVTAIFMFGLGLGGLTMNFRLKKMKSGIKTFIAIEAGIILLAVLLPLILAEFSSGIMSKLPLFFSQTSFMALLLIAGFLTGVEFPLSSKLYIESGEVMSKTAGLIDWADHFGACFGALLTGAILVPILGMVYSCWLIASLNLACLIFWMFLLIKIKISDRK